LVDIEHNPVVFDPDLFIECFRGYSAAKGEFGWKTMPKLLSEDAKIRKK
jgi:hypothetical protein